MHIIGAIFFILWAIIIFYVAVLLEIPTSLSERKEIILFYAVVCGAVYAWIGFKKNGEAIILKKHWKIEKVIIFIVRVGRVAVPGLYWILTWKNDLKYVKTVGFILIITFEIFLLCVIDEKKEFEYRFAKIYFYKDDPIDNIKTDSIKIKGSWMIIEDEIADVEYRFQTKDIKKVEYSDKISCDNFKMIK